MNRGGMIAIDTETTGLRRMEDTVLFWSMGTENARWCFTAQMLHFFTPLFSRADVRWCLANAKYDLHLLANMAIELVGEVEDILVMDAMVDVNRRHGLKAQAQNAYGIVWGDFKDVFLNAVSVKETLKLNDAAYDRFKMLPTTGDKLLFVHAEAPHIVAEYASCDAFFTYKLWADLTRELMTMTLPIEGPVGFKTLYDYFQVIEVPFTKVLWRMERKGILVDLDYVKKIKGPMEEGLADAKMQITGIIGDASFNPASPAQLGRVLFSKDGFDLTPIKTTATKKPSTDKKALEALAAKHAGTEVTTFIMQVLAYRKLEKVYGTYVKGMKKLLCKHGRMHTQYNQAVARTARLSCVAEWTPVQTPRGKIPISDIAPMDYVWTHQGRWRRVLRSFTKGMGRMYDIHFSNGEVLTCTIDHKLLSKEKEWLRVGDLIGSRYKVRALFTGEGLPAVTITEVHYRGSLEVHDLTVDEDASYLACGVLSHNSSDPNLQNIPRPDPRSDPYMIRSCFISKPGYKLVDKDYQIGRAHV